jgi:hypothetical protein
MPVGMSSGELFDLAAKISVDDSGVNKSLTSAQRQVVELAKEFQKTETASQKSFSKVAANVKVAEQSASKLSGTFKGMSAAVTTLDGPLGGIASRIRSLGTLGAELTTSAGAIGIAIGAISVASVGAAFGIFKLVTSAAEATGKLHDLSQQTGFSVETLSALKNAAETSGGSINTVAGALGIFQRHMEEANEGNKETSRLFKALNIDVRDNEKALRQAFDILSKLPAGAQQTAISMKLFGRSGREVMGIFKEAGGDLDAFIQKLRDMGLLITTESARAGDKLSDSVTILGQRFAAVGRQVANEFAPEVTSAIEKVGKWLTDNKATIIDWSRTFADMASSAGSAFAAFGSVIAEVAGRVATSLNAILADMRAVAVEQQNAANRAFGLQPETGATNFYEKFKNLGPGGKPPPPVPMRTPEGEFAIPGSVPSPGKPFKLNLGGGGGGGGGKGGDPAAAAKRLADINLQIMLDNFKSEEEGLKRSLARREIDFSIYSTSIRAKETERHQAVIDGLAAESGAVDRMKNSQRKQIAEAEIARKLQQEDIRHKQALQAVDDAFADRVQQVSDFIRDQSRAIAEAATPTDKWQGAISDLVESLDKQGITISSNIVDMLRFDASMARAAETTRNLARNLAEAFSQGSGVISLEGGPTEEEINAKITATMNRTMGSVAIPENVHQQLLDFQDRMHELASDLTSVIDRSISDGFSKGITSGLASFASGILEMIKGFALRALEQRLFDLFSNALGGMGKGGGGIASTIGSLIMGAFAGAAGGVGKGGITAGTGGKYAEGGFARPNTWNLVGEEGPELIRTGKAGATVLPNSALNGQGGHTINVTFVLPNNMNAQSFMSQPTQHQIAKSIHSMMAKAVLTG